MLGELLAELKGKSIGKRVLDVAGPTIEISVSLSGNMRGTSVTTVATYVNKATSTSGVLHGKGQGIVMARDSEVATFTGEGLGRVDPSGNIKWRAAFFYQTKSSGKLAFLNGIVGVSENEVDAEGNVIEKNWEWK
jgi:hypothetical protein